MSFLQGNKVALTPIDLDQDAVKIAAWMNDPEVTRYMFYGQTPSTVEQVRHMLTAQVQHPDNVVFLVTAGRAEAVGFAGLYNLHRTARHAEFRVLIGNKSFWKKGIGTEVTELLTFYAFDRLNLNKVYLGYTSANENAGKAYLKAGYVHEGTLRQDIYRNGEYYDTHKMSILRSEFYPERCEALKARWSKTPQE